jgi:hypothetical protein
VVWNIFYFPFHIWDVILPIDELIFFKMVIAPPTSIISMVFLSIKLRLPAPGPNGPTISGTQRAKKSWLARLVDDWRNF